MRFFLLYFLFFTSYAFSQFYEEIEKNENLKKYNSIEIIDYYGRKKSRWTKKISLKDGKTKTIRNYNKSTLTYQVEYCYNKKSDLDYEVVKFEINKGKTNDTINCTYIYNDKNQLIERGALIKEFFSNFNALNLPQTIETEKTALDSLCGYRKELIYNFKGNIIEEKVFSKINNKIKIETTKYKYDGHNNVIELNRDSLPKNEYPIIVTGGRTQFENEKFRYVYNSDNLWIEKFWIVENKEYLIQKRKFK